MYGQSRLATNRASFVIWACIYADLLRLELTSRKPWVPARGHNRRSASSVREQSVSLLKPSRIKHLVVAVHRPLPKVRFAPDAPLEQEVLTRGPSPRGRRLFLAEEKSGGSKRRGQSIEITSPRIKNASGNAGRKTRVGVSGTLRSREEKR
jgi:hypothetical protein